MKKIKRFFPFRSIRSRLVFSFVLVTLLPAAAISLGSILVSYSNGHQKVIDQLESVAEIKRLQIDTWMDGLENEAQSLLEQEYMLDRLVVVLNLAEDDYYLNYYNNSVRKRLESFVSYSDLLREVSLLDMQGNVVLSSNPEREGENFLGKSFFREGLQGGNVFIDWNGFAENDHLALISIPVYSPENEQIGILTGISDLEILQEDIIRISRLGQTGKVYLLDENSLPVLGSFGQDDLLGEVDWLGRITSKGINQVLDTKTGGSGIYNDFRGEKVLGVYYWLPEINLALLVEQDSSEAFNAVYTTLMVNLLIAVLAAAGAVLASLWVSDMISKPIISLADTATRIAAGDLGQSADLERADELGQLARVFNSMTSQLRDLINKLEDRVRERTFELEKTNQALKYRALQMETSSRLSRELTSILNTDDLLAQVVHLINESFGYYLVNVFLLDEETVELDLQASSDEKMSPIFGINLKENSLNGAAVLNNEQVLVNDVAQNENYLRHDYCRDTRSELVLPLRIGDRAIGTLDIHSLKENAFTQEDIVVLQSLGDQISIAIENARLYANSQKLAIVEERNRLARELHDSVVQSLYSLTLLAGGWQRLSEEERIRQSAEYVRDIGEISKQALKEMRLLVYNLRPPLIETEGLQGALYNRLEAVERRAGIEPRLICEEVDSLPLMVQEDLYRISLEALNNSLKHAGAGRVLVHFYRKDGGLILKVEDNGKGFSSEQLKNCHGMGIAGMKERARGLGALIEVKSRVGEGTVVELFMPIEGQE